MKIEKFIPHTLQHLIDVHAFPQALPEAFYSKMQEDYAAIRDVQTSRITYESDGLKVTGLMALPAQLEEASHPLLIYCRGGSKEYGMLTLVAAMRSMIPFAKKGYLVYASNYRGNDGGDGHEEFGGADVDDILNLIAIAKTNDSWDRKNIFLIGHSRGGMMVNLTLKRGAKVNAAISIAGVSDARELNDRPKMVENLFKRYVPGYNQDPIGALTERSSVCWPEQISAPLLLIHGDADKDVPPHHSTRLAVALARLKKPHELIIIEGGNHALVRQWDVVLEKCITWLERHRV